MNDDLRGRIFSKALNGRWSSATAEKVAKRLGLESFENKPDVSLFDPMTRPAWTLAMAGAWLSWRTREKVCESWDEYCKDWLAWRAFERSDGQFAIGYELVNVTPTSLLLQGVIDPDERPPFMSAEQAKEALWNALGSGQIKASAIPNEGLRPVEIPSHEWSYVVLTGIAHYADRLSFKGEMTVVAYREVTVRRDDILSIWQDASQKESGKTSKGGRPAEYDWDSMKDFALDLVDQHGRPARDNKKLSSNEDLVRAICDEWTSKRSIDLNASSVRKRVSGWLKEV